jgi:phosphopantetheinyl transferase (holo-ACP synthase)
MTSTGNDIISLNAINVARTNQPQFYSKILSDTEKDLYNQPGFVAIPFENFVWLLWSIKESAYKYLQRKDPGLIFHPVKFIVKQLQVPFGHTVTNCEAIETEGADFDDQTVLKGVITYGPDTLYSRSLIYTELILSVVNDNQNFENTFWGVKLIDKCGPDHQSTEVRRCLVNRLKRLFPESNPIIVKSPHGFPVILNKKNEEADIPVSLSHHDDMVAYAIQLGNISN